MSFITTVSAGQHVIALGKSTPDAFGPNGSYPQAAFLRILEVTARQFGLEPRIPVRSRHAV